MAHPARAAHGPRFRTSVIAVRPGIWTAVGFAASNVHMIEGAFSITIVDTSQSTRSDKNIMARFRKLTSRPVGRIIYTRGHRDRISGASVLAPNADVPVLASATFKPDCFAVDETGIAPPETLHRRTGSQFGTGLSDAQWVKPGCGPANRPMDDRGAGYLAPTRRVSSNRDIALDGVPARLIVAPGEASGEMGVWLPKARVLLSGGNWSHAFPILFASRGSPDRDLGTWADNLDLLEALGADVLAPGHTMPVIGAKTVSGGLTSTRAAILNRTRHTARTMEAARSLDDIAATESPCEELAETPWIDRFCGNVGPSARAFAVRTRGSYVGSPTYRGPAPSRTRAGHVAALGGGAAVRVIAAKGIRDVQWPREPCDLTIAPREPADGLRATAKDALADQEVHAAARSAYPCASRHVRGRLDGARA